MNLMENVWAQSQKLVPIKIRDEDATNRDMLWNYISDSWESMRNTDIVENMYRSMPRRMQAVIEKGGYWTGY